MTREPGFYWIASPKNGTPLIAHYMDERWTLPGVEGCLQSTPVVLTGRVTYQDDRTVTDYTKLQERQEMFYLNVKALLGQLLRQIPAIELGQLVQHIVNTPYEKLRQEAVVATWGGALEPFIRELALTLSGQAKD